MSDLKKIEFEIEMYDKPNGKLVGWYKLYIDDELVEVKGIYNDKTITVEGLYG